MRCPPGPRFSLACLLSLATFLGVSPAAAANENTFLYTLTGSGRTSLQVTPLDTLSTLGGRFTFADIAAGNGNRWTLSIDGRVFRNGTQLLTLPFPPRVTDEQSLDERAAWVRLVLDVDDLLPPGGGVGSDNEQVLSLSAGGMIMLGGDLYAQLPTLGLDFSPGGLGVEDSLFVDMVITDVGTFALRADGALFDVGLGTRIGTFSAGPSLDDEPDGAANHTQWMRLAMNASNGFLYALRADGVVISVVAEDLPLEPDGKGEVPRLGSDLGSQVGQLPATTFSLIERGNLYIDIEISDGGTWNVLRRDGAVFSVSSQQLPFLAAVGPANFGPNPVTTPLQAPDPTGNPFIDMVLQDGTVSRVRSLGQLYSGDTLVDQLLGSGFVGMAGDSDEPDLSGLAERAPALTVYKPRVVVGEEVVIPIIPIDVDAPVRDLTLTFDLTGLPGAVYDEATGTVRAPGDLDAGRYSIRVTADDGEAKPVRKKYKVTVLEPTAKGRKIAAPLPTRMSRSFALIGHELALPIKATDRNGDPLTIEPINQGIFLRGATFDSTTNTLHWLPECIDAGRREARFRVSNGTKTSRLKVKIDVLFPLFWDEVPVLK